MAFWKEESELNVMMPTHLRIEKRKSDDLIKSLQNEIDFLKHQLHERPLHEKTPTEKLQEENETLKKQVVYWHRRCRHLRLKLTGAYEGITETIKTVCDYYGVTVDEVEKKCRRRKMVMPRQIIGYICTENGETLDNIGSFFAGKDHATVIYGNKKVKQFMLNGTLSEDEVKFINSLILEP